jgi:Skp family chaperone for outer membrane proteins
MNGIRLLIAFVFVVFTGAAVLAQQPSTQPSPRPAAPQPAAPIPEGRMALIYSEDFRDPKTGIARYSAVMNSLNSEFQPRQTELNQMAQKMQQLQDEITKLQQGGAPVAQSQIQAKADQYEQLKKEYQRKAEDAQAVYKKRHEEVMAPLNQEIGKALEAYAKAHGITVIIDGNQVPLVYAAETIDITKAFINEFNSKNPATASATPRE